MSKLLFQNNHWTMDTLADINEACQEIAVDELKLSCYPNVLEVISADQMLDAYTSHGLPAMYKHWSYGKRSIQEIKSYEKGWSGLAYEIVINSNPTISYLMETNSATMQALVIAHAAYGHNNFFKSNYLFKQWTDATNIIDYLVYARDYIARCEERYGIDAVERVLDACHAIQHYSVDKYKRPSKQSNEKERLKKEREQLVRDQNVDAFWDRIVIPATKETAESDDIGNIVTSPEENLLYFIEKNSPVLKEWERETCRIVRKIAQYFYPQRQTQVMNEGWASTVHYYIMNRLHQKGLVSDGNHLEFLASHTSVVNHQPMSANINPYWLGFNMFAEIKRVCQNPTKEDEQWFPELVGQDWLKSWHYAVENFRDESFIRQYLTPKFMREGKFLLAEDQPEEDRLVIRSIHNDRGYEKIRNGLAESRSLSVTVPDIQITGYSPNSDRTLLLTHYVSNGVELKPKDANKTLEYIHKLWGFPVFLTSQDHKSGFVYGVFSAGDID